MNDRIYLDRIFELCSDIEMVRVSPDDDGLDMVKIQCLEPGPETAARRRVFGEFTITREMARRLAEVIVEFVNTQEQIN